MPGTEESADAAQCPDATPGPDRDRLAGPGTLRRGLLVNPWTYRVYPVAAESLRPS